MENQESIYEKLAKEKMQIAARQIAILNHYDNTHEEQRLEDLYSASHSSIIGNPSEHDLEQIDKLVKRFQGEIQAYRQAHPETEQHSDELRNKISELESALRSS